MTGTQMPLSYLNAGEGWQVTVIPELGKAVLARDRGFPGTSKIAKFLIQRMTLIINQ